MDNCRPRQADAILMSNVGVHLLAEAGEARRSQSGATKG